MIITKANPVIQHYRLGSILLLVLLNSLWGWAQPNTLVTGKVSNPNALIKIIDLQANTRYIDNNIEKYSSNILADGTFAFAVEIKEPQYVSLTYSRNKGMIYLEPNDTLHIEFDGQSFPFSMQFSGRSGNNNTFLYQYFKAHPQEWDPFKFTQYRKGIYWYSNSPEMNRMMQSSPESTFQQKMALRKEKAYAALDFYVSNHPNQLTPTFKEFISTEILYDWAYHMLLYGHVFKNKHQVSNAFFSFVNEVPLNGDVIGNYWFREFLLAHLAYLYEQSGEKEYPYRDQYDLSKHIFVGRSLAFIQSEMIYRAFNAKKTDEILGRYWDFIDNTEYLEFEAKVNSIYQKVMRYAEGSPAHPFQLKDINGQSVSLSQFQGKVVYLNFWASWCRPCMNKMRQFKPMMKELEKQGVVFVNVSLDRNSNDWQNAVQSWQFNGVHVLAPGDINSDIASTYEVKILPQYYIINKYGSFAQRPKKNDVNSIRSTLLDLVKR
ncbi:MAG: TlpA disulfide reductase family protein [Bacteroidota bacterium]